MQGWQIFHAYDIRATTHSPKLTQESERRAGGGGEFKDGLPDHVTRKEHAMSKQQQFQEKALRVSSVCGERNTDAHLVRVYFYVNRRILCISAVKSFRPQDKSHSSFHR